MGRSPFNVVRVELPDGRYTEAATVFDGWKNDGALGREATPALYAYRMTYQAAGGETRHTFGVMGALVLEPPGHGILPHEQTTPKAKGDRLELIRAVHANTSPIWCLCTEPGLVEALGGPSGPRGSDAKAAIASARDDDGTLHEIWPIEDERARQEVAKIVAARPLLVADGHHRYETALAYQAEQRAEVLSSGGDAGGGGAGYDALLAFVVELSEEHLQVLAIHRLVSGMPADFDFLGVLGDSFELEPTTTDEGDLLAEMVREAPWPWPRKAAFGWRGLAPEGPTLAMSSIRAGSTPPCTASRRTLSSTSTTPAGRWQRSGRERPTLPFCAGRPPSARSPGPPRAANGCRPRRLFSGPSLVRAWSSGTSPGPQRPPQQGDAQVALSFPSSPALILESKAPTAEVTPE